MVKVKCGSCGRMVLPLLYWNHPCSDRAGYFWSWGRDNARENYNKEVR